MVLKDAQGQSELLVKQPKEVLEAPKPSKQTHATIEDIVLRAVPLELSSEDKQNKVVLVD